MSIYNVVLSPLKEIASRQRLKKYYLIQKELKRPVYYLLPSNKWLQAARKRQPGMAFKTFDDIADLILKKADIKYVQISEAERDLFFQQLLSNAKGNEGQEDKAKAYSQTYGQLMRLGLTLKDLPEALSNLKPALESYEQEWVKKRRLLDPENRFHEALNLEGLNLPLGHVIIDGYMDFSPLQYKMLNCLIKNGIAVTIYIQGILEAEIIGETLKNLKELGFQIKGEQDKSHQSPQIQVSKAVTQEEEIRAVLIDIMKKIRDETPADDIGVILADEGYKEYFLRIAEESNVQVQIPKKLAITESVLYKTIILILRQNNFSSKWDKVALVDQIHQLLFIDREHYWESKKEFMLTGSLPQAVNQRLDLAIRYRKNFKKSAPLVEVINELVKFLQNMDLMTIWKEKVMSNEDTDTAFKIRNEWLAFDDILSLLKLKKDVLEEQGLQEMGINLNIFSGWFQELLSKKEIYIDRKPAKGINLYSFREAALFRGEFLYVLGMNEGVFPSCHRVSGYFQETDLKALKGIHGLPTKSTFKKKDEGAFKQLFYLAQKIYFSYVCGFDPENEYQPSPFIEEHCIDVDYLCAENRYKEEPLRKAQGYEQAAFMLGMGKKVENAPSEILRMKEHLNYLSQGEEKVSKELTSGLVTIKVGATTLEQYAACPFRFGMERLLKILEPKAKEDTLKPLYTGSMFHRIIEKFYTDIGAVGKKFCELSDDNKKNGEQLLLKIFHEEWEGIKKEHTDIHEFDLELEEVRWANMLRKWWMAELDLFWNNAALKDMKLFKLEDQVEYTLEIDKENTLTIIGKVDRIDVDDEGFVIYDYKSGKASLNFDKEVKSGLKLQIPLYILIVQNKIKSGEYPELKGITDITAHGASYVSLKEPLKRATNGVWRKDNAGVKGRFKVSGRTNKEDTLEGDTLMEKYKLKDKIKELWLSSHYDYSVRPLDCHDCCPYNGVCRVSDELKEEGENSNGAES